MIRKSPAIFAIYWLATLCQALSSRVTECQARDASLLKWFNVTRERKGSPSRNINKIVALQGALSCHFSVARIFSSTGAWDVQFLHFGEQVEKPGTWSVHSGEQKKKSMSEEESQCLGSLALRNLKLVWCNISSPSSYRAKTRAAVLKLAFPWVILNRDMTQCSPSWWRIRQMCREAASPAYLSATSSQFLRESIISLNCFVWYLRWPVQGQTAQTDLFAGCQLINLFPKCKIRPADLIVFSFSISPLFFFFFQFCFLPLFTGSSLMARSFIYTWITWHADN